MSPLRLSCYCLLFLVLSCQKKNIPGPAGPQGPAGANGADNAQKGPLTGKLNLYDTAGNPLTDNSGAIVSLEKTSPLIQATTAADGSFTLTANEGVYNISVQKQGYGTMRFFSIVNVGTQQASRTGTLYMSQQMPSTYDVKSLKVDSTPMYGNPTLNFTVTLTQPRHMAYPTIVIFLSDSTGVGNGHNKAVWYDYATQINDSTITYNAFPFKITEVNAAIQKADHFYLSLLIDNSIASNYRDEQGNIVLPGAAKASSEVLIHNAQHNY